jgi:DNA-binding MarR family transcriptional regulator
MDYKEFDKRKRNCSYDIHLQIKKILKHKPYSVKEIAKELKYSQGYISQIMNSLVDDEEIEYAMRGHERVYGIIKTERTERID